MGVNDSVKSKTGRFRVLTVSKLEERYEGHPSKNVKKKTIQRRNDSHQILSADLQNRVCPFCTNTFDRNTELNRHIKRKHLKPYKCGACPRTFGLQSDLDRHVATHYADNRFYACKWEGCQNKSFSRKQHLERHINKMHTKSDPQGEQSQKSTRSTIETVLRDSTRNAKARERQLAEQSNSIVRFLYAVAHEDLTVVDSLLAHDGVDINHVDINGRSALHIAAENDSGALITFLLSKGADAGLLNRGGLSPITVAAAQGNEEALHAMLDFGCHDFRRNALSAACAHGQLSCVRLLLKSADGAYAQANKGRRLHQAARGRCLYQAARNNHVSIVEFFLTDNIDISDLNRNLSLCAAAAKGYLALVGIILRYEKRDDVRRKALFEACEAGHVEMVRLLLTHVSCPHHAVYFKGSPTSLLSLATQRNDIELAKILLDSGASPDISPSRDCRSPFEEATFTGNLPFMRLFLQHINLQAGGLNRAVTNHALAAASASAKYEMIRFCLEQGAEINCENHYGETALLLASKGGHQEAVQCLLEHGADANHADHGGRSALMLASRSDNFEYVQTLLDYGANVFHQDSRGQTLLFYAAENLYNSDCLQQLLGYGLLSVNHTDHSGKTALMAAVGAWDDHCVQLLLEHGADLFCADNDGRTALSEAMYTGKSMCLRILLKSCDTFDSDSLAQVFQQALERARRRITVPVESSEKILRSYAESRGIVLSW